MKSLQTAAIPSPCTHICKLDGNGICIGCFRTKGEIARWLQMNENERQTIAASLDQRRKKSTEFFTADCRKFNLILFAFLCAFASLR